MASRPSPALVGELVGKRRYAQRECLHGCQRVREIQRERILRHFSELEHDSGVARRIRSGCRSGELSAAQLEILHGTHRDSPMEVQRALPVVWIELGLLVSEPGEAVVTETARSRERREHFGRIARAVLIRPILARYHRQHRSDLSRYGAADDILRVEHQPELWPPAIAARRHVVVDYPLRAHYVRAELGDV
eukprot:CAMPEP_0181197926 /NCGR_PEP_ID=MMETSP1096-20121128/16319_1 /TAXON_ID=156174 ORGANISM="Chrysochromulina ericina, Strain CCMP281" /NCGR_SAMPLE_ID=MMETSP1096 /ASSEMBLY_ACC=CAM_ASM_000453 /LENGTH=191 /DNA_ID=CAMNT_0023287905 /DNA_START=345 /DNA_END=920 /DNA_ORIENTATION=-